MAKTFELLLETPEGMPAGTLADDSKATFYIPPGRRILQAWLKFGDANGITVASGNIVTLIEVYLGTKLIRSMTAKELNAENSRNGAAYALKTEGTAGTAGYRTRLPIYFHEPWRKSNDYAKASGINIAGVSGMKIVVTFKAGIVSPVLSGWYRFDALTDDKPGTIVHWIRDQVQASGVENTFKNFERDGQLQSMTFFPTVEGTPKYVDKIEITVNGIKYRGLLTVADNQADLLGQDMNPDTAAVPAYEYVADATDQINDMLRLNGADSFEVYCHYNAAAAGNMTILRQVAKPF